MLEEETAFAKNKRSPLVFLEINSCTFELKKLN
jgi:hypothetical protein